MPGVPEVFCSVHSKITWILLPFLAIAMIYFLNKSAKVRSFHYSPKLVFENVMICSGLKFMTVSNANNLGFIIISANVSKACSRNLPAYPKCVGYIRCIYEPFIFFDGLF